MLELLTWHIKDSWLFKDAKFDFRHKGVSVIRGKNLNAGGNTNFAGKSLFFSLIPELIFGVPLSGNTKDKLRTGIRTLAFRRGKDIYVARQTFSPTEKLTLFKNKEDLQFRELKAAREHLQRLVGFSREEFETLVYLDSRLPHPLVSGDTGARRDFFTQFFRLHSAEAIKDLISAELRKVDDAKLLLAETLKEIQALPKLVNTEDRYEQVDALRRKQKTIESRLAQLQELASKQRVIDASSDIVQKVLKLLPDGVTETSVADKLASVEERLLATTTSLKEARRFERWQEEVRRYKQQRQRLQDLTEGLTGEELRERIDALKAEEETLERLEPKLDKAEALVASLRSSIDDSTARIEELKSKKCSKCGQPLSFAHDRSDRLKKLTDFVAESQERLDEVRRQKAKLQTRLAELRVSTRQLPSLKQALSLLESLQRPEPWVGSREFDVDDLESKAERLERFQSLLTSFKPLVSIYVEVSNEDNQKALQVKQALEEKLVAVNDQLNEIEFELRQDREALKRRAALRERRKELLASTSREAGLLLLEKAYSKKGIQAMMIRSICSRLEQLANKYGRLLFDESYQFSFSLAAQFVISATRKAGKDEITSDVRKLSGAESILFTIILLLCLYSFVPKARRCSVLILDEPDSNMGPQTQEAFIRFLRVLNKLIPHIVVITPRVDANYDADSAFWTVVKQGNTSTLVKGA